jgi:hypothetical protein
MSTSPCIRSDWLIHPGLPGGGGGNGPETSVVCP